METAFNIIVVILSIFLAIFLILGIIVLAYAYKFSKTVKRLGGKAEVLADDAQDFVSKAKGAVAPAVAAKMFSQTVKNFSKKSKVKVKK